MEASTAIRAGSGWILTSIPLNYLTDQIVSQGLVNLKGLNHAFLSLLE